MNKVLKMKRALSAEAFITLGYAGVTKIGSVVSLADGEVLAELRVHGVIGENDGLTIIGSGVAAMAQEFVYDLVF